MVKSRKISNEEKEGGVKMNEKQIIRDGKYYGTIVLRGDEAILTKVADGLNSFELTHLLTEFRFEESAQFERYLSEHVSLHISEERKDADNLTMLSAVEKQYFNKSSYMGVGHKLAEEVSREKSKHILITDFPITDRNVSILLNRSRGNLAIISTMNPYNGSRSLKAFNSKRVGIINELVKEIKLSESFTEGIGLAFYIQNGRYYSSGRMGLTVEALYEDYLYEINYDLNSHNQLKVESVSIKDANPSRNTSCIKKHPDKYIDGELIVGKKEYGPILVVKYGKMDLTDKGYSSINSELYHLKDFLEEIKKEYVVEINDYLPESMFDGYRLLDEYKIYTETNEISISKKGSPILVNMSLRDNELWLSSHQRYINNSRYNVYGANSSSYHVANFSKKININSSLSYHNKLDNKDIRNLANDNVYLEGDDYDIEVMKKLLEIQEKMKDLNKYRRRVGVALGFISMQGKRVIDVENDVYLIDAIVSIAVKDLEVDYEIINDNLVRSRGISIIPIEELY